MGGYARYSFQNDVYRSAEVKSVSRRLLRLGALTVGGITIGGAYLLKRLVERTSAITTALTTMACSAARAGTSPRSDGHTFAASAKRLVHFADICTAR